MAKEVCPRCSGELKLVSGFRRCSKCSHVMGSQNLIPHWSLQTDDGFIKAKDADSQTRPDNSHNPKRRNPLEF